MQVVFWQRDLVRIGHGPLQVDGWFGQATSDVTKAFQDENGLDADGVVGASTRSKMAEVVIAASKASWPGQHVVDGL
jgi:peptidoglycan hydrolase-like protein with peptidoglycan-binding domain